MDILGYRYNNRVREVERIMNKTVEKWLLIILIAIALYYLISIRMPCGGYFGIKCFPGFICQLDSQMPDSGGHCIMGVSPSQPLLNVLGNTPITVPVK